MTENKNKNPIWNAYLKADQFLVDRATEAVKAWNWTTGRTRAELANIVSGAGHAMVPLNYFLNDSNVLGAIVGGLITGRYIRDTTINNLIDLNEQANSADAVAKDLTTEITLRNSAMLEGGLGALSYAADAGVQGIGFGVIAISEYIMRADCQRPRKDCVRRGLEHLTEVMSRQPALETSRNEIYAGGLI